MPITQRAMLYFGLLLFSVPLQYYIAEYYKFDGVQRYSKFFTRLHSGLSKFQETFLNFVFLRAKVEQEALLFFKGYSSDEDKEIEQAFELLKLGKNNLASDRPKYVQYRVGQVVSNTKEGYKAVIIAWRLNPKNNEPLYTLLIDDSNLVTHRKIVTIPQDYIHILETTTIKNRYIKMYFESYDGTKYIPQPWLKSRFPKD